MKFLDLAYNHLEAFFEFPASTHLETVNLSYNRISDLGNLSRCPHIKNLDLKNNKLVEVPEEIFNLEGSFNCRTHNIGRHVQRHQQSALRNRPHEEPAHDSTGRERHPVDPTQHPDWADQQVEGVPQVQNQLRQHQ